MTYGLLNISSNGLLVYELITRGSTKKNKKIRKNTKHTHTRSNKKKTRVVIIMVKSPGTMGTE